MLCIIHSNLAKCCSATHLPWIILFDRQVKYFSFLILLLLLARKEGSHGLPWEASWRGCLIEASVEFNPGRQRLNKKNPLDPRDWSGRCTESWQSRHVNSLWVTLWTSAGDVHVPLGQLRRAHQSSSACPARAMREIRWKAEEQLVLLSPRWMSHQLNVSGTTLFVTA